MKTKTSYLTWSVVLLLAFAVFIPSMAHGQTNELRISKFQTRSSFGGPSKVTGDSLVIHEGPGHGEIKTTTRAVANAGPGLLTIFLASLGDANGERSRLLLGAVEMELTSTVGSETSDTIRKRCDIAIGNVPNFLDLLRRSNLSLIDFALTLFRMGIHNPDVFGGISCTAQHQALYDNLKNGEWLAVGSAKSNIGSTGQVEITVGASGEIVEGALTFVIDPVTIYPPSSDRIRNAKIRFSCTQGLAWSDVKNKCICDYTKYPNNENHPVEACRPTPVDCGPREIERDGACITCPPGTAPINNECVEVEGPDDCNDSPDQCDEGGPDFCARNPEHDSCLNCESNTVVFTLPDGTIEESTVVECESTFRWGIVDQADFDCLLVMPHLCVNRTKTTVVSDPSAIHTGHLSACTEGLGWQPCPDTDPLFRTLVPENSYIELFPECHRTAAGVSITPCDTTLPDGSEGPDLVIEDARVVTSHPAPGEPLVVSFTVANHGTEAAANATWLIRANIGVGTRTNVGVLGSLAAGGSRSFTVTSEDLWFVPEEGPYSFRIVADHNGSITELREDNNERLVSTYVSGSVSEGIDLIANISGASVENPVLGQNVTAQVTVSNIGTTAAPASTLLLSTVHPSAGWLPESRDVPPLGPGESMTTSLTLTSDDPGLLWMTARADASYGISESNESNNEATLSMEFTDPEACLPCTSGAPVNAVGATLCFDHVTTGNPATGDQYRCFGVRNDGTSCSPGGQHPNGWYGLGLRCPDPWTLCEGLHPDRCGNPDICPGTAVCD